MPSKGLDDTGQLVALAMSFNMKPLAALDFGVLLILHRERKMEIDHMMIIHDY